MRTLVGALLSCAAAAAAACGVCVEDKIASCYDHAVVTGAKARGHAVAFFAIRSDVVANDETRRELEKALGAAPGVQPGTVRISLENGAFSFAFDPARLSSRALESEIFGRLAARRIAVAWLRTL